MLSRWFGRSEGDASARTLYLAIVAQARSAAFYADLGIPDTLDGRFELIALHSFLVMQRLKQEHERTKESAQALFDEMFTDLDHSLREMGAGDLGVGRRVKTLAKSFFGRVKAYEAGLAGGSAALQDALARNLLGSLEESAGSANLEALEDYVRASQAALARQSVDDILEGRVSFIAPGRKEAAGS